MDKKNTNTTTADTSVAQPLAQPAAQPVQMPAQPIQQPVPAPPMVQPQMPMPATQQSMAGGGSLDSFFRGVNWVDVGILMLGTAALYYTIYYYRIKIKAQKRELADMSNKLDMMDAKVLALQKSAQESASANKRQRRDLNFSGRVRR